MINKWQNLLVVSFFPFAHIKIMHVWCLRLAYQIIIIQMLVQQETHVFMSFPLNYCVMSWVCVDVEVVVVERMLQIYVIERTFIFIIWPLLDDFLVLSMSSFAQTNLKIGTNNKAHVLLQVQTDNCYHFWVVYWILICVKNKKLPQFSKKMSILPLISWINVLNVFHWNHFNRKAYSHFSLGPFYDEEFSCSRS